MNKVQVALDQQWEAAIHHADTKLNPDDYPQIVSLAGTDADAGRRARVILRKAWLKREFPLTFTEALNPTPLTANPTYKRKLQLANITGSSPTTAPYESSILLLMALQEGHGGIKLSADQLGASSIRDFSNDGPNLMVLQGLQGIADDWGKPLVYYRWPTNNPEVNALGPTTTTKGRDPQDPQGLLMNSAWLATPGRTQFQTWFHPLTPANVKYLKAVFVSSGPDMKLGLDPTDDTMTIPNSPDVNDNIYSYRLQRQGSRGD
jgi:hypothetical protein